MVRPRIHDEQLRELLIDRAARAVADGGLAAVSLRALAAAAGTSTAAVYSLFGGKPELLQAVTRSAFGSFARSQAEVPTTEDAVADLFALGLAYRRWATANPHLYRVMFGGVLAGCDMDPETVAVSDSAMEPLRAVVQRGLATGALHGGDVDTVAVSAWALVHGFVSLETSAGTALMPAEARDATFREALLGFARGWSGSHG